ncbi:hypothetical protein BDV96DRAFT_627350 [Lophiotrema nucula]|uniref:Zn(2)-C6 fungal-type domain-containing protein n=1 Tax=Lophiotrema nucula TaxID=690887 RepID=A0A6A5ZRC6_9PLEO|nr:hypothetical protein BDV96DRAFT_627350 [Lophiotrema nucula]
MPFPSRDIYEFKNEADILHRAARPQRHSDYIPRTRDWRYVTGVYQHEDFESEKEESIWDKLDADILTGTFGRERRKVGKGGGRKKGKGNGSGLGTPDSGSSVEESPLGKKSVDESPLGRKGVGSGSSPLSKECTPLDEEVDVQEGIGMLATPALTIASTSVTSPSEDGELTTRGAKRKLFSDQEQPCNRCRERGQPCVASARSEKCVRCRKAGLVCVRGGEGAATVRAPRGSRPSMVATFEGSKRTGLRVVLKLGKNKIKALEKESAILRTTPALPTPAPSEDRDEAPAQQMGIKRQWVDETTPFNMRDVYGAIREPGAKPDDAPPVRPWFPEAVSADTLFPPGSAMTMTEILAFYPHHILWDGVHERLLNNGYQSGDIQGIQAWFRGRRENDHPISLEDMKTIRQNVADEAFVNPIIDDQGRPTGSRRDQYTDFLRPSQRIAKRKFTVPTFDDLVAGLKRLPPDGRVLTQCVEWYLKNKNAFHPPLELNVLHAQSLYRALQIPLEPLAIDIRNLDHAALSNWQKKERNFEEKPAEMTKSTHRADDTEPLQARSSNALELTIAADGERVQDVRLHKSVGLRHVLLCPALSILGSLVGALQAMEERIDSQEEPMTKRARRE